MRYKGKFTHKCCKHIQENMTVESTIAEPDNRATSCYDGAFSPVAFLPLVLQVSLLQFERNISIQTATKADTLIPYTVYVSIPKVLLFAGSQALW